ncbi:hypothetical protein [Streptomyces marincola]|uniref:hypothetical protein n=1 Tax=Streptomyces marincola TaxID=2878388 RepID=UPI00131B1358|nr:hypothetical protein [Streptomyces marincola]
MDMEQDLYDPLFPAGSNVDAHRSFEDFDRQPARACRILVDDEMVLNADASGWGDAEDYDPEGHGFDKADGERVPGEFEAVVWPGLAVASAPCAAPGISGHAFETLTLVLEAEHPGDDDESREVLAGVIQPLFAGVLEMTPCEEHA